MKGKKYTDSVKSLDKSKLYEVKEGLEAVVSTAKAKFDETVELHVRLGVDGRNADQQVRGVVVLPNGTGKTVRVLAICKGDNVEIAEKAGADYVGAEEMIAKIQGGWFDFDTVVTTFPFLFEFSACQYSPSPSINSLIAKSVVLLLLTNSLVYLYVIYFFASSYFPMLINFISIIS